MIDLKLTESGDFILSKSRPNLGIFKLSFRQVEISGFGISFLVSPIQQNKENSLFRISFTSSSDFANEPTTTCVETVNGDDYVFQKLKIALSTVLGDIGRRLAVGSRIVEVKHSDITSEINLALIQTEAYNAIKSLMPTAAVKAVVEKDTSNWAFYCQTVKIYITNKTSTYSFTI